MDQLEKEESNLIVNPFVIPFGAPVASAPSDKKRWSHLFSRSEIQHDVVELVSSPPAFPLVHGCNHVGDLWDSPPNHEAAIFPP